MTISLGDLIGYELEEQFFSFDLTQVEAILSQLAEPVPSDIAHAETAQQAALRAADILATYLAKMVKHVSYLESSLNSTKNKVSLEYSASEGRTTMEMKKWAAESSPEVDKIQIALARAKGSKLFLEKKYDLLIRQHHHLKDISSGMRRNMPSVHSTIPHQESADNEWGYK
jgi:hypothetical protein